MHPTTLLTPLRRYVSRSNGTLWCVRRWLEDRSTSCDQRRDTLGQARTATGVENRVSEIRFYLSHFSNGSLPKGSGTDPSERYNSGRLGHYADPIVVSSVWTTIQRKPERDQLLRIVSATPSRPSFGIVGPPTGALGHSAGKGRQLRARPLRLSDFTPLRRRLS